jgi:ATP adenylyltransferase
VSVAPVVRVGFPEVPRSSCTFCRLADGGAADEVRDYGTVVAFLDAYPVSEGHYLIVPKRHVTDYFDLSEMELRDSDGALRDLRDEIMNHDSSVRGFNLGANCGEVAGQTVAHAHIHLIPRRHGDTPDPRGGVRGVIPENMSY